MASYPPRSFLNPQNWWNAAENLKLPAYPRTPDRQFTDWMIGNDGSAATQESVTQGLLDFIGLGSPGIGALNMSPGGPIPETPLTWSAARDRADIPQFPLGRAPSTSGFQPLSPLGASRVELAQDATLAGEDYWSAAPQYAPLSAPLVWTGLRDTYGDAGYRGGYGSHTGSGHTYQQAGPSDSYRGYDGIYAQAAPEPFDGMATPSAVEHFASRQTFNRLSNNGTRFSFTMGDQRDTTGPFKFVTEIPVERNADGSVTATSTVYGFDENTEAYTTIPANPDAPAIFRIGEDGRLQVFSGEQ